ncbi:hypothetical protein CYY_006933 [Polysphondylium violaceum]|uniref:Transmembrane protein n=1 Tax=Polysphondylium violaceum TaxID=133409 RepID=A0A8J4PPV8_9MYCE|nr:hypothetical protein CYY_006933 [Polysphondylium violaceum]
MIMSDKQQQQQSSKGNTTNNVVVGAESKELQEIKKEISDLSRNHSTVQEKGVQFKEQIHEGFRHLDEIVNTLAKHEKEASQLTSRIKSLSDKEKHMDSTKELSKQLGEIKASIKRAKTSFTPETGSVFVRLFLGQVNVKHYREFEKFRLKQEYEKFKKKTNPQFILFVVLLLLYPHSSFITTSWQIWLLYYYVTLALRENILLVNGSAIKPWWIIHHYLSIAGSLTNLLWPFSPAFSHFLPQVTYFSGAQGLVQILTNRYQQGRLYKLVAMGKANIIDVTGESEGWNDDPGWTPSALFLLPFLLFVQFFQLYNSFSFFAYAYTNEFKVEWQVLACGLIFLLLGVGNLTTTMTTYYQKWTSNKKVKDN